MKPLRDAQHYVMQLDARDFHLATPTVSPLMPKTFDIVFWVRAGLGAFSGLVAGQLGFVGKNPQAYVGIFVAITVYMLSLGVVRTVVGGVPKSEVNKVFTTGLGAFIMLFLFTWILYNTLFLGK